MAKALGEKLASDSVARKETVQQFVKHVRSEFKDMTKALEEKLSSDSAVRKELLNVI